MAKVSRRVYISGLIFVLIFLALGATTFAWFTLAEFSQLNNLNFSVSSGSELSISLDENGEYSDEILSSDIKSRIGKIQLGNLTSIDGKNLYVLNDDFSLSKEEYKKLQKNKFIEITFFFRAIPENVTVKNPIIGVYLSDHNKLAKYTEIEQKGTFVVSKGVYFNADVNYYSIDLKEDGTNYYKAGEKSKHYASDAIMISFEDNSNGNTIIYDLNAKEGHNYNDGYSNDISQLKGAASYYYNKTGKNPGLGDSRTAKLGSFALFNDVKNPEVVTSNYDMMICTLKESSTDKGVYYGSSTVRIWVEGFDADCFNAILSDQIMTQFSFRFGYYSNNNR